jgi:hypothetical protein
MSISPVSETLRGGEATAPESTAYNELLAKITILGERPGGLIDAMVPSELICREDVPVDAEHVAELAASIKAESEKGEGTGQLSPILLGEVEGYDQFLIIDGFHRDGALHELGEKEIFTTIRKGSTLEEVVDLRILTANTHSSVNFARVVEWISDAWIRGPWVNKLSVVQAFSLTNSKSSGKIIGLSPEEAAEVKAWVVDKCEKWRMSPSTVHINLVTAELADPELVKEARRRVGGHSLETVTPQHLGVIAKGFPRMYPWQRLVVRIAKDHNMNILSTRAVVEALKVAESYQEAVAIAKVTDWASIKPAYSPSRKRELDRENRDDSTRDTLDTHWVQSMAHKLVVTELRLARISLDALVLRGRYAAVDPNRPDHPELIVAKSSEAEIDDLIRHVDIGKNVDGFLDGTERLTSRLVGGLQSKYKLREKASKDILRQASLHIVSDMENGDLRFVELTKDSMIHDVLVATIREELTRRRDASPQGRLYVSHSETVPTVTLPDTMRAVSGMSDLVRRASIAHGILGLTVRTTAKLLDKPIDALPHILRDGHAAILSTSDKLEQRKLEQVAS